MSDFLHLLHQEHTNIGKLLTVCERLIGDSVPPSAGGLEIVQNDAAYG